MRLWLFLALAGTVLLAQPAWAGDGVVALQTADASCRTTTTPPPRYVDCGNGTVTDNKTGLVWLKKTNCLTAGPWSSAMEFVAGLSDLADSRVCFPLGLTSDECDCGLSDGSSPGEWRLASADEWYAMVAEAKALSCSPTITNDSGDGCWDAACVTAGACSFTGLKPISLLAPIYWSASTSVSNRANAWYVHLDAGYIDADSKTGFNLFGWPVRGGQ